MVLDFPEEDLEWPEAFEKHLKSKSKHLAPRTKAQHRLEEARSTDLYPMRVQGRGNDDFECVLLRQMCYVGRGLPGQQGFQFCRLHLPDSSSVWRIWMATYDYDEILC